MAGGRGDHCPSCVFEIVGFSEIFNVSLEYFRTFAVGKDTGFEFYRKIFELGPPTLLVPRRPCPYIFVTFTHECTYDLILPPPSPSNPQSVRTYGRSVFSFK